LMLGIGVTATAGQILLNKGLQLEKAAKATAINYLQIVFAFIWEASFLHVVPSIWTFVGASIILGWAAISNIRRWRNGA